MKGNIEKTFTNLLTDSDLKEMSNNIEGMTAAKKRLLTEMCADQKCDDLCIQKTHMGQKGLRPRIRGMCLAAKYLMNNTEVLILVRNNYNIWNSTSTSIRNNTEIIQVQLNNLMVMSVYKPPNERFSEQPQIPRMHVVIVDDFNNHSVDWWYRSLDENVTLAERWI